MTPFLRKFLGMNWILFALMTALAVFGVVAIYSVVYMRTDFNLEFWTKQAQWVAIGIIAFLVTSLIDYRWVRFGALPMYLIGLVFLVMVLIFAPRINGAKSWLSLPGITFQPAQVAVIAGIMVLAIFLSQFKNLHPMIRLTFCAIIVGAPCALIFKQPDLGETLVWGPTVLAMLFIGGIPLRYLISIGLVVLTILPPMVFFGLNRIQYRRITAFIDPDMDPHGSAWAINQTLTAIGSGGWAGKGFKAANSQIELGFVPRTAIHNDFIFAAVGEQWGFIGGVILLGAFALLLLTCLYIAFKSADDLGLLLVTGISALMFTHIVQNIGMTIAMLPITGLPLPLISYSGSFIVMTMFGFGLVNSVWVHRKFLPD